MHHYFLVFASLFILIQSEEELKPPNGQSFYRLTHPDKGTLNFALNFTSTTFMNNNIKFVVGNQKPCMFSLGFASTPSQSSIRLVQENGGFNEEKTFQLDKEQPKLEISYFKNLFTVNSVFGINETAMDCEIDWMLLNEDTAVVDVLLINDGVQNVNITWSDDIKYYDSISNGNETEDSTTTTTPAKLIKTTSKLSTTTKKQPTSTTEDPNAAEASGGIMAGIGIAGFILGCLIGGGSVVGYLHYKKKKSKSDVKTVGTTTKQQKNSSAMSATLE